MKMDELRANWADLPFATLSQILAGRRALILAPHPDDESLGTGGLIAACCAAGTPPIVAILTDGAASHPGSLAYPPERLRQAREAEAAGAVHLLGLPSANLFFLRLPDTKLADFLETAAARIQEIARAQDCGLLIAPWAGDPHCDHEAAASIAAGCGLPVLYYPVWGWLRNEAIEDARPLGWRLNISEFVETKQRAIAAHASQYGGLIQDSPAGFRLPAELLAVFAQDFEVYLT
jgi:LmbE family N-acetylglucosaminyl deacetylase